MWHPRRRDRGRSSLAASALALLLIGLSQACGSPSQPPPTPEPTAPPSVPTAAVVEAIDSLPATSAAPADGGLASPANVTLPPPVSLSQLPSVSDVVAMVTPAVASISVETVQRGLFFDFPDEGAGSGIVVSSDGYIVTNFHVIQDVREIIVDLPNGETYIGRVVGRDRVTDLAIIKVDAENLPTATFGDSDLLKVGDWVVTLGNALALKGGPTVTLGIVSGRGRTVETERGSLYDMIQTDAAINDGNSGGPLINLKGEVVGINTAILRQAQGIGFAVSSETAKPIIDSLIEHGRVVRPLMGMNGRDVTPAIANRLNLNLEDGVIVTRLSRDGPAFDAGIRAGDVITKIDGIPTPDMARFLTLLWTYDIGDQVAVEYVSNYETRVTPVVLAERPPE